jgi:hypothetical protein
MGRGVIQVDTFTAEQYSAHQIERHNSKVQAPAQKGTLSFQTSYIRRRHGAVEAAVLGKATWLNTGRT